MQTFGPTLPVRGYAELPGVWAARDVSRSSPTKSGAVLSERRSSRRRSRGKRLPPMRSPAPSGRASSMLQSFSRSPSPVKRNPLPLAYSQDTNANPMASFGSSLDEHSFVEDSPAAAAESAGLAAEDATDGGWKTQYGVFDLTAAGGAIVDVLQEVQGRLKEAWLMGPSMPLLRTAPILKLLKVEHLDLLKKACVETQPLKLQLEKFRVRRVRHAHAGMLELDAVFSSPGLSLMKEHWLSMLGDAVDDLEVRLYDRSLSYVHVPLGRVGAEWSEQMAEFTRTMHDEFLLPLEVSVSALHVLEDAAAGSCSVLRLQGKAAQWEKDKRRPGWMSLLISDALNELDAKPPLEHTFESLRAGSAMSVSGLLDEDGRPLSRTLKPEGEPSTVDDSSGTSVVASEDPAPERLEAPARASEMETLKEVDNVQVAHADRGLADDNIDADMNQVSSKEDHGDGDSN